MRRLGWSTEKGDLQAPVGYDGFSFAYRDKEGTIFHQSRGRTHLEPYGTIPFIAPAGMHLLRFVCRLIDVGVSQKGRAMSLGSTYGYHQSVNKNQVHSPHVFGQNNAGVLIEPPACA